MLVRHLCEALYIKHITSRIRDCLTEEALGVLLEASLNLLVWPVRINEGTLYSQLLHCHSEEVERTSVNSVRCYKMVSSLADVEYSIEVGGLTRGGEHSPYSTLKRGNLLCHCVIRRVGKTCVEIAGIFQVKEPGHLLTRIILKRR